jgi:hypothetical protein
MQEKCQFLQLKFEWFANHGIPASFDIPQPRASKITDVFQAH